MISHRYKCIFIHIPRCAGTSIERWITGDDWWDTDAKTKHLIASQARELYSGFWDTYFKFSFVRDPADRVLSCLKYGSHFGLEFDQTSGISFSGYHELFGADVVLEHDHRFYARSSLIRSTHRAGSVYGNMLDEELDFIGRYETLRQDLSFLAERLGIETPFDIHSEKSDEATKPLLKLADAAKIVSLYREDFPQFGYENSPSRPDIVK